MGEKGIPRQASAAERQAAFWADIMTTNGNDRVLTAADGVIVPSVVGDGPTHGTITGSDIADYQAVAAAEASAEVEYAEDAIEAHYAAALEQQSAAVVNSSAAKILAAANVIIG